MIPDTYLPHCFPPSFLGGFFVHASLFGGYEPLIAEAGFYDCCDGNSQDALPGYYTLNNGESITLQYPFLMTETGEYIRQTIYTMDEVVLNKAIKTVLSGEPNKIFTEPNSVIAVVSSDQTIIPKTGETISLTGSYTITQSETSRSIRYGDTQEYTICAVVLPIEDNYKDISISENTWIMSNSGRKLCGLSADTWDHLLVWFSEDAVEDELQGIYENLINTPSFMRYHVTASAVQTASEERIQIAVTSMLSVFFIMLYLSFCTMTFTDSFLKITRERRELSILRQLGADDNQIHKTTRSETYPTIVLAICITLALALIIPTIYILTQTAWIRALGTEEAFPKEVIETMVDEIIQNGLGLYTLFLPAFPIHFLSIGITVLGTYLSTKRILHETIAEGIRKDTD